MVPFLKGTGMSIFGSSEQEKMYLVGYYQTLLPKNSVVSTYPLNFLYLPKLQALKVVSGCIIKSPPNKSISNNFQSLFPILVFWKKEKKKHSPKVPHLITIDKLTSLVRKNTHHFSPSDRPPPWSFLVELFLWGQQFLIFWGSWEPTNFREKY